MKILASKNMSLFCFCLNCVFGSLAVGNGQALWAAFSFALAALCLYNYNQAD